MGTLPRGIFNISSLVYLNMKLNGLSGEIPNDMCGNENPKLKRIIMDNNQLLGRIPPNIGKCKELEEIWLSSNELSGSVPIEIGSLSKLKVISFSTNRLTGMAVFLSAHVIFFSNILNALKLMFHFILGFI